MKIIKKIHEQIEEELEGGLHYAKCAVKHKDEFPALSRTWYEISLAEMSHVDMLHKQVVGIISDYRAKNGQPPEAMLAVYNYLHERAIERAEEVKRYQEMYRQ
jgi:hypothetical protein